jgi:hypothetical protein
MWLCVKLICFYAKLSVFLYKKIWLTGLFLLTVILLMGGVKTKSVVGYHQKQKRGGANVIFKMALAFLLKKQSLFVE